MIAYLDSQLVVWLCEGRADKLSEKAAEAVEKSDLLISPMVLLELEYLYEIKRIVRPSQALLHQLRSQIGVRVCDLGFTPVVETALFETWTRDPFDRVIVAHAKANGYAPLVTSDRRIRANYAKAVW